MPYIATNIAANGGGTLVDESDLLGTGLHRDDAVLTLATMSHPADFVSEPLPVLYTIHPMVRSPGIPTLATLDLAVVAVGSPSFLAPYTVPEDQLDGVVASLQSGDVRLTVTGVQVEPPGTAPMAFVSLQCADGRRLAVARLRGAEGQTGREFAAQVSGRVARGRPLNDPDETGPAATG